MSVFAAIAGIGMVVVVLSVVSNSKFSLPGPAIGFLVLWVCVAVGGIGYHLFNAGTGKGHAEVIEKIADPDESDWNDLIALREREEISVSEFDARRLELLEGVRNSAAPGVARSVEERLTLLASLKAKNLISADEYETKRTEILSDV